MVIGRIPFIQDGIANILAKATNGLSVVLEHRYYGESMPTQNLSTESLRFLTTEQAVADTAYFAEHVVFPGFENRQLMASNTPWIVYGGSYAGGFAVCIYIILIRMYAQVSAGANYKFFKYPKALCRIKYPDIFWGAISSSGITEAFVEFWQFYEPMRLFGPQDCISTDQKLVNILDNIMIGRNDSVLTRRLKGLFGVADLSHDDDFAIMVANGIAAWENLVWDPRADMDMFWEFCGNITVTDRLLYPQTAALRETAEEMIVLGGWQHELQTLINPMLNLVGYLNLTSVSPCIEKKQTIEQCLGHYNVTCYQQDDIHQTWRTWPYQKCTQYVLFLFRFFLEMLILILITIR